MLMRAKRSLAGSLASDSTDNTGLVVNEEEVLRPLPANSNEESSRSMLSRKKRVKVGAHHTTLLHDN